MVAEMGGLAERQIAQAFDALVQRNSALARQIIDLDANLDAFQAKIEAKAISIIAQRQPLAVDLRAIISTLHISNDLERIGDLAKNIGKRTIAIGGDTFLEPISKSPEEDNEAGELDETEEVLGVVFPPDQDAALPLDPGEEALDEPASHVAA